jgi:hypothetical protein
LCYIWIRLRDASACVLFKNQKCKEKKKVWNLMRIPMQRNKNKKNRLNAFLSSRYLNLRLYSLKVWSRFVCLESIFFFLSWHDDRVSCLDAVNSDMSWWIRHSTYHAHSTWLEMLWIFSSLQCEQCQIFSEYLLFFANFTTISYLIMVKWRVVEREA